MTVNVLGTDYTIVEMHENDERLDGCGGICDRYAKEIFLATEFEKEPLLTSDFDSIVRLNKRHELVHAFLNESGLMCNTADNWSRNEEMVDWIAIQLPKMVKAMQDCGAM